MMALKVLQTGTIRRIARLLVPIACAAIHLGSSSAANAQVALSLPYKKVSNLPAPLQFFSPLVEGRDGVLYGAAGDNQANPDLGGAIFRLDRQGQMHILHRFHPDDGLQPESSPVVADDGCLYGSTLFGGENQMGTIYRFDPHSNAFSKIADIPMNLLQTTTVQCVGPDGALYGTCMRLNGSEQGGIFRCTRQGELSLLHVLTPADDTNPGDALPGNPLSLIASTDGNFYGFTQFGGPIYKSPPYTQSLGVVFKLTPSGDFSILATFNPTLGTPSHLTEGVDGALYMVSSVTIVKDLLNLQFVYQSQLLKITKSGVVSIVYNFGDNTSFDQIYATAPMLGQSQDQYLLIPDGPGKTLYRYTPGALQAMTRIASFPFTIKSDLPGVTSIASDGFLRGLVTNDTNQRGGALYSTQLYTGAASPLPPVARDDYALRPPPTSKNGVVINVLTNDSDKDRNPLEIISVSQPAHGTATIEPSARKVRYQSDATDTLYDNFTYTIGDGLGGTATAQVYLYNKASSGFYSGLLPVSDGSGFLQIQTSHGQMLTGALFIEGRKFLLRGMLDEDQTYSFSQFTVLAKSDPTVLLTLKRSRDSREFTGNLSLESTSYQFTLPQMPNYTPHAAGKYTIALPPNSNVPSVYGGAGYGLLQVGTYGTVTSIGRLQDGTPFSIGGRMDPQGNFQLYSRLYINHLENPPTPSGWLSGIVQFRDTATNDCTGALQWIRPAIYIPRRPTLPAFSVQQSLIGSRWNIPEGSVTESGLADETIRINSGLTGPLYSTPASASTDDLSIVSNKYNISVQENFSNGLFSGVLNNPAFGNVRCSGVILQKRRMALGQCFGNFEGTGLFEVTP